MRYEEAVDWLFSRFPSYQNLGSRAYKPSLNNALKLMFALGNPEQDLKLIHIAGTNGKGSTSHILAALCQSHGLKTGIFTSPHLLDFRERIKIDGQKISKEKVIDWVEEQIPLLNLDFEPSFFELTFALALSYFRDENCDICIIETGLGGRLDATNVIQPVLTVITNIGLDHMNFLGDTRALIAGEKAGIIKPNTPTLIAQRDIETEKVFKDKVKTVDAKLRWVDFNEYIPSDLLANYQQLNLNTAKQAFLWFANLQDISVSTNLMDLALKNVAVRTDFHGRMELIQENPRVIVDAAHNADGIRMLLSELKSLIYKRLFLIYGAANDKDLTEVFPLFPDDSHKYFAQFSNARSRTTQEWEQIASIHYSEYEVFKSPLAALNQAKDEADTQDLILVFGSFFLIGDLFENLQ